jgi:hypothetical protein
LQIYVFRVSVDLLRSLQDYLCSSNFQALFLAVISPKKPKVSHLAQSLGFLAQLTRVCEESKNMMNKNMIEDKLVGSSKLKFLEDKTSEENLL